MLDYFEPYLGRIEIMGSAGRIERVYFEITQSHINQWEKPQIKVIVFSLLMYVSLLSSPFITVVGVLIDS